MTSSQFKRGLTYVLVVFMGITAALILYFYQFFYQTDHFLPGVTIASVPVGGQDRQEAVAGLEKYWDSAYKTPVLFIYQDFRYITTIGDLCRKMDTQAVINDIWQQEQQRDIRSKILNLDGSKPIPYTPAIKYNSAAIQRLADDWNEKFGQPALNPQLEVDRVTGLKVIPGQEGQQVSLEKIIKQLPDRWGSFENLEIPIILEKVYPSITEEDLKVMGELSSFTTWYNNGEVDRTHNLTMAAAAINTQVVQPGQKFSFNQTVGARTFETGYRDAMVIVSGKFEPGVGGGICQVSSTLYNAVLKSGLDIVERHNHALAVAYVPVGLDATVVYGIQDFQFKNNTGHPIYLRAATGGGKLTVTVYGHLSNKKRIELSSVIDKVIPFSEVREIDPQLAAGEEKIDHNGIPGYVARSFKTVYDENGEVAERVQLATDHYKPLNKLIYVGPGLDNNQNPVLPGQETLVPEEAAEGPTGYIDGAEIIHP